MAKKRARSSKPSSKSKQLTLPLSGKKRTALKKRPKRASQASPKPASARKKARTVTAGQVDQHADLATVDVGAELTGR